MQVNLTASFKTVIGQVDAQAVEAAEAMAAWRGCVEATVAAALAKAATIRRSRGVPYA